MSMKEMNGSYVETYIFYSAQPRALYEFLSTGPGLRKRFIRFKANSTNQFADGNGPSTNFYT